MIVEQITVTAPTKPPLIISIDNLPVLAEEQAKAFVREQYDLLNKHLQIDEPEHKRNWFYSEEDNKIVIVITL